MVMPRATLSIWPAAWGLQPPTRTSQMAGWHIWVQSLAWNASRNCVSPVGIPKPIWVSMALPGAARLLAQLPDNRFAIVTSATRPLALARLGYAGLPVPRHMVTADDVVYGKPSPEPYLKGAALLGFTQADCLIFEDSPAGISSARSAGMKAIALQTTYPADQLQAAHAIIGSLADVKANLADEGITLELAPFPWVKS